MDHSEAAILNEIWRTTGLRFKRIGQIDTSREQEASGTLPILACWVPLAIHSGLRHEIYHCFHTPFAKPFLDALLHWWKTESVSLNAGTLSHCLAMVADSTNASRLFEAWRTTDKKPAGSYYLLARLAVFESVARPVKDELVRALNEETLNDSQLGAIARVNDRRIQNWFLERIDTGEYLIRKLARRIAGQKRRLPVAVRLADAAPDKAWRELFSAEVNLFEVKDILALFKKRFGVRVPRGLASGRFLDAAPVDTWLVTKTQAETGERRLLWFRLEDIDVVEIVLTEEPLLHFYAGIYTDAS